MNYDKLKKQDRMRSHGYQAITTESERRSNALRKRKPKRKLPKLFCVSSKQYQYANYCRQYCLDHWPKSPIDYRCRDPQTWINYYLAHK